MHFAQLSSPATCPLVLTFTIISNFCAFSEKDTKRMKTLRYEVLKRLKSIVNFTGSLAPLIKLVWRASPRTFIVVNILTVLTGLLPVVVMYVSALLLDALQVGLTNGEDAQLFSSFVVLISILAVCSIFVQMFEQILDVVKVAQSAYVENKVRWLVAEKASAVTLEQFENPQFHDTLKLVSTESAYRPIMFVDGITTGITSLVSVISILTVLFLWKPWIVLVIIVSGLANLLTSTYFATERLKFSNERAENERRRDYFSSLFSSLQSAKELRLYGLRNYMLNSFKDLQASILEKEVHFSRRLLRYSGTSTLLVAIIQAGLITYTALQAVQGNLTIGEFSLYYMSIQQAQNQFAQLMLQTGSLYESNLYSQQLFQYLTSPSQPDSTTDSPNVHPVLNRPPPITFDKVSYSYQNTTKKVLSDVEFTINPGEVVAFVGENGAGKSSLIKLISGLYSPTEGRITVDGHDIQTISPGELNSLFAVVSQDFEIFHFSLADNIYFGDLEKLGDAKALHEVAEQSGVSRLALTLPDKYETILGLFWNKGHELSGGQKQAVAIARASLRQAPILILDEPTAALDVYAEQRVFASLLSGETQSSPQTVIFISHRFSTVRLADRIFVLKAGHLVEQGSHKELMDLDGYYAQMFNVQGQLFR